MAVSERSLLLAQYLAEAAAKPFAWGQWDCATGLVAGWIVRVRGTDPAKAFRGAYGSQLGAWKTIRAQGGMVPLFDRLAAEYRLPRVEAADLGDVAVIRARTFQGVKPVGAIRCALGWAVLAEPGLTIGQADALAIWSV